MANTRKLAAIMFTDIVGYSAIMSLDEKKALKTIGKNRELHKSAIKQFKGEYIKEIGDNTISSFDSALNAVSCAVYIQQSLKDDPELNLRIGIHIGDIVIQSNDILGDSINIASRIETFAKNGDICISGHVYNYIHNIPGIEVEPVNDIQTGDLKHDEKFFFLRYENYPEELTSFSVSENEKTIYPFFFWQELRRRKVIKAATMYAAGAFGILEAFDILFPNVIVPDWLVFIISIVVIAGFAITVYISWRYEVTSEGIQITEPIGTITDDKKVSKRQGGLRQWLSVSNIVIALLLIMVGILIYPKLFQKDKFKNVRNDDGRISLAVMPFKNLTGDTLYNVWQEGLQNLLISTLTNSKELSVRQFSTMYTAIDKTDMQNYASITPSLAGEIAQNLDSKTFILGNILKFEDKIRISAQLVNAKTEEIYKSYQIDGWAEDDIFTMSDSLANFIKRYFDIKVIIDDFGYPENFEMTKTNSAEALRYYIMGMESFILFDYIKSIGWLQRAIEIDSNFVSAYFLVSMSYYNIGQYSTGLEWFETAYQKGEIQASVIEKLELEWLRTLYKETPYEQLEYIEQILKIEDQSIFYLYLLGWKNVMVDQYEEAIEPLEKAIEISHKLKTRYFWSPNYTVLGECYHQMGEHEKEAVVYKKGLSVLPENADIIRCQAICNLSQSKTKSANAYLNKYISIQKNRYNCTEAELFADLGDLYLQARIPDSAIKYHRKALQLEPDNYYYKYLLAWDLIDNEVNVDEGLALIDEVLEMDQEYYQQRYYGIGYDLFLDTKGWGLFKKGLYMEAMIVFEKALDLRTYYDHRLTVHMKETKMRLQGSSQ